MKIEREKIAAILPGKLPEAFDALCEKQRLICAEMLAASTETEKLANQLEEGLQYAMTHLQAVSEELIACAKRLKAVSSEAVLKRFTGISEA